jgi:hypothetical protein
MTLYGLIVFGPLVLAGLTIAVALVIRHRNLGHTALSRVLVGCACLLLLGFVYAILAMSTL